jgi:predicted deacylase
MSRRAQVLSVVASLVLLAVTPVAPVSPASAATPTSAKPATVIKRSVFGTSVQGRDLVAFRLGEPKRPRVKTVVLMAAMHGNESAPSQILRALVDGLPVVALDLWVIPTYNPDGVAAGTRKNAHGVDLNRNFPNDWKDLDGSYESGPKPASEPETKAVMDFLEKVDPDTILSFHQPLTGVDTDTKNPRLARRVARKLELPRRTLDCGGTCHGTMTGWFNNNFDGSALTVEYGANPTRHRMRNVAPDQVLSVFRAVRGRSGADPLTF